MPKWIAFSSNNEYYKCRLVKLAKELGYDYDTIDLVMQSKEFPMKSFFIRIFVLDNRLLVKKNNTKI